jgi:hypothetical protein
MAAQESWHQDFALAVCAGTQLESAQFQEMTCTRVATSIEPTEKGKSSDPAGSTAKLAQFD